jgi:hypothetical protein
MPVVMILDPDAMSGELRLVQVARRVSREVPVGHHVVKQES